MSRMKEEDIIEKLAKIFLHNNKSYDIDLVEVELINTRIDESLINDGNLRLFFEIAIRAKEEESQLSKHLCVKIEELAELDKYKAGDQKEEFDKLRSIYGEYVTIANESEHEKDIVDEIGFMAKKLMIGDLQRLVNQGHKLKKYKEEETGDNIAHILFKNSDKEEYRSIVSFLRHNRLMGLVDKVNNSGHDANYYLYANRQVRESRAPNEEVQVREGSKRVMEESKSSSRD